MLRRVFRRIKFGCHFFSYRSLLLCTSILNDTGVLNDYVDQLWLKLKTLRPGLKVDDQLRINKALDCMGVKWNQKNDEYYEGHTTDGNTTLTVTVIPQSVICRKECNSKLLKQYYVWHPYLYFKKKTMSKRTRMTLNHVWILNDNWNASLRDSTLKTEQWLMNITKPSIHHT